MYKICIVGTAYPYRGGLATYTERMAKAFQEEGHQVDIVTFILQYPSFLFPGKTQFSEDPEPKDLSITRKINTTYPLNWLKAGKYINRKGYDMVIFCYWTTFLSPCYGTIARKIKNSKKAALIHNMFPHEKGLFDKILPPFFVKSMDAFVTMSKAVLEDVEYFDRKKPKIISPHPMYDYYGDVEPKAEAAQQLSLNPNDKYILFFGFIRAYKGLDWLIQAFADERLRKFPVKLLIAGEFYESRKLYDELIQTLKLEKDIILHTKFINNNEVKHYFSLCDMVAQPYKSATQSGVSQIAYHFEKPMIATRVGGLPEIIPHGKVGYIVEPNPKAIADGLVDFLSHDNADIFQTHIKEEKKKYQWETMVSNILSLYQKLNTSK